MKKFFACIAYDPDYDRQHILSHVKSVMTDSNPTSLKPFNNIQVSRALQSVRRTRRTAQGSGFSRSVALS